MWRHTRAPGSPSTGKLWTPFSSEAPPPATTRTHTHTQWCHRLAPPPSRSSLGNFPSVKQLLSEKRFAAKNSPEFKKFKTGNKKSPPQKPWKCFSVCVRESAVLVAHFRSLVESFLLFSTCVELLYVHLRTCSLACGKISTTPFGNTEQRQKHWNGLFTTSGGI